MREISGNPPKSMKLPKSVIDPSVPPPTKTAWGPVNKNYVRHKHMQLINRKFVLFLEESSWIYPAH